MDFNLFVNGLRNMGLPNEQAVYIAYVVDEGLKSKDLTDRMGTYGVAQVEAAIEAVEKRA